MLRGLKTLQHHLLSAATIAYTAGLFLSQTSIAPDSSLLIYCIGFTAIFSITTLRRLSPWGAVFLIGLTFQAGAYTGSFILQPPQSPTHISRQITQPVEVVTTGRITQLQGFNGETSKLDVKLFAYRTADHGYEKTRGVVRLTSREEIPLHFAPGDTVIIRATLSPTRK